MTFLDTMHAYFRGERIESLAFIVPAALGMLTLAWVGLRIERGPFGIGFGIPLLVFGLVALSTGLAVGLRTPAQVAALEAAHAESPAAMLATERPRMERVNANWPLYLAAWVSCVVIGCLLRFLVPREWAHGVGPALVLVGALGLTIDGFAERRARVYTAALSQLAADGGRVRESGSADSRR
jgi:hypothetical protein